MSRKMNLTHRCYNVWVRYKCDKMKNDITSKKIRSTNHGELKDDKRMDRPK